MHLWVQTTCKPLKRKFTCIIRLCLSKKKNIVPKILKKRWYNWAFTIQTNDDRQVVLQVQWTYVNSIVFCDSFRVEVQSSSSSLLISCNCVIPCSKPLFVDVIVILSPRALRYFSRGLSRLSYSTRLLRPSLLSFKFIQVLSQQQ